MLPRDGLQDVHEAILEAMEEETIAQQEVVEEKVVVPVIKEIFPDIIGIRSLVCERYDRINGKIKKELIENLITELYK